MGPTRRRAWPAVVVTVLLLQLAAGAADAARRETLELRRATLELPGMPAKLLAPDLDGDGRRDVLAVIVYDEAETIVEERVEELVSVTTVIPAILERRELRAWIAQDDGGFRPAGIVPLPTSVMAMETVADGASVVALTDTGVARVRFSPEADEPLTIEPWIDEPPAFAGAETFLASLDWVDDLGEGRDALLIPAVGGLAIHRLDASGARRDVIRVELPGDRVRRHGFVRRDYPWPRRVDVDGDDLDDLVIEADFVHVLLRRGDRFVPPYDEPDACTGTRTALRRRTADGVEPVRELEFLGDLDGEGTAEAVETELHGRDGGMRAGLKDTKRPRVEYRLSRLGAGLVLEAEPYQSFIAPGHGFDIGDDGPASFSRFDDLDADGRVDLTTVTLKFSMLQLVRVLATKRIGVGLEFHVWTQDADGRFREVEGLDLSEKLRFDLGNLELGRFAQFAGDFDGDGRRDFVHLGRGRVVTIHRGRDGCRYPAKPDLAIELDHAPQHVGLVRIGDLDGDARDDLSVMRVDEGSESGVTAGVVVELYLSRGAS